MARSRSPEARIVDTRQVLIVLSPRGDERPMDSFAGIYTSFHGVALLGARRFAEALPFLRAAIASFAENPGHYHTLISCCGHLGLAEEARLLIEARNRMDPPVRVGALRRRLEGFAHREVFVEGLAKAGVPE